MSVFFFLKKALYVYAIVVLSRKITVDMIDGTGCRHEKTALNVKVSRFNVP